jgi:16S rRNA (cytidine1402-2'-O)-methyltransferase
VESGRLLVVSTPIGNLGDLSARAREALEIADLVACEDTRRSGLLLHGLGIKKPLLSLHEHNERQRLPRIVGALAAGQTVALVSDAGTPLVSDPGFLLVRAAVAQGAAVEAIPGPSAILAALVVSGLPAIPFTFAGFPPAKSGKRRAYYRDLARLGHTLVIYESPHRLRASLADALAELGDRPASLSRELTKLHEETVRGGLVSLRDRMAERAALKGEFVLVIGPAATGAADDPNDPHAADRAEPAGDRPAR